MGTEDPHDLDLTQLVPRGGLVDGVWFVPSGRGRAQLVVAWQHGTLRGRPATGYLDQRRYVLTLWDPEGSADHGRIRWVPHALVSGSPFPIVDYRGHSAVRLADVTGDGHADLLVTVGCTGCNHGTSAVFVVATFGRHVQRIYGQGFMTAKDPRVGVHGRMISESDWGSSNGLLWFATPYRDYFSGIRTLTFLRWTGQGWRTVSQQHLTADQITRLHLHQ